MTIWLFVLILLASLAALGYRQGAIRVAFSFVAILVGALLAVPLGNLVRPLFGVMGVKDPLQIYLLPPVAVFIVISIAFKVAGAAVHRRVEVYYKYRAGDLRMALWERLNHRLGACLGLANGVGYLILLSVAIFSFGYVTIQLSSPEGDPAWMRLLTRMGKDMEKTGFSKVARALDHRTLWYKAADLAGTVFANPLVEARLSRYPAVLGLAELAEFKDLGSDKEFAEMRQRHENARAFLEHPRIQTIRANPELLQKIWDTLSPDFDDLMAYLRTGLSAKYDPVLILGRWSYDVNYAMILYRRTKPSLPSSEMLKIKNWMIGTFATTELVGMTDERVLVKNLPQMRVPSPAVMAASPVLQNLEGTWKKEGDQYQVTLAGSAAASANIQGDRLLLSYEGSELVFVRQH